MTKTRLAAALGACGLLVGLAVPPAGAAQPNTANSGETVDQLHREVQQATLLAGHGTRQACPQCDARLVTTKPGGATPLSSTAPAGYGPADLRTAYHLPAGTNSTATIAIIDAGVDATLEKDLAT